MRVLCLLLLAGLLPVGAGALENLSVVSDTVSAFEKVFNVRGRVDAWFTDASGSTLRYAFPGKGSVSFHLAAGPRHVDKIQVEPLKGVLSPEAAADYARRLVEDWSRSASTACRPVRNDDDGINAFAVYACGSAAKPVEVTTTVQTVGGRRLIFAQFSQKPH